MEEIRQKAVKSSPFPRSYYRCTTISCGVKKRVERLIKDTSIVITTYEGTHTHPCRITPPRESIGCVLPLTTTYYDGSIGGSSEGGGIYSNSSLSIPQLQYYQDQQQQPLHYSPTTTLPLNNFNVGYSSLFSTNYSLQERRYLPSPYSSSLAGDDGLLHDMVSSQMRRGTIVSFFRRLCQKVITLENLDCFEIEISETLNQLERIFPPTFFDIMIHLPIHLANEVRLGGPIQNRWMYPPERYMCTLKSYVRNKNHPEGSIAEAYLVEECLTLCFRYLHGVCKPDLIEDPEIMMNVVMIHKLSVCSLKEAAL
ncbi:PREDICTED: uncharacterized protein LOC109217284 [Nicotiana attenuata]|uniref:uncharacterized protein LOC109217284 n=1 Tax=Nicotiana attenuata TaxID=49451 RepID=UPI000904C130|nr:PREDICTED: uncharacterized protein LOC109217284 [Nicotiana attenuata]